MTDDRPAEVLDHITRPGLPWRAERLTECGRPADGVQTITADELRARVARLGKQRTAFTVCMTCAGRVGYSKPWAVAPELVLEREIQRRKPEEVLRLRRELAAVTALVEAHREEFDAMVDGLADTPSLTAYRRTKRQAR